MSGQVGGSAFHLDNLTSRRFIAACDFSFGSSSQPACFSEWCILKK
jgi:hypothetical protein